MGKFPVYDQTYDFLLNRSSILNDERRANDFHNSNALAGISECEGTLIQLMGNPNIDGMYLKNKAWYKALIPHAKDKLNQVGRKFKKWQNEQVELGHALQKPITWPRDLEKERLKGEALLDIRHLERKKVKQTIKDLKAQKESKRVKQVLPNGPLGNYARPNQLITEADGQRVSYSEEGIPFIDEPTSPYHQMPIAHYRKMSKQWVRDMGITIDQLRQRRDEIFEKQKKQAIQIGEEPPLKKLVVTPSKIPDWMKRLGVRKKDWPEWPEDAKPITELE